MVAVMMTDTSQSHKPASVLELHDLTVTYTTEKGPLDIVRNVSLNIRRGEVYGLVGESGSGKTTLAMAVVRYLARNGGIRGGSIFLNGQNLLELSPNEMRRVWGSKISIVHQDPSAAINPTIPVGEQVAEVARLHLGLARTQAWQKTLEMFNKVQLSDPESVARRYAHQLSGGMLQRILIATALMTNPQLLIMDEPTTALDVTTEAVILDLIKDLLGDYQTAVLYITHNLGVVARVCDRVGVMYAGELIEEGTVARVFEHPRHPYTVGLLGCVPRVDQQTRAVELHTIPGHIPQPDALPDGCIFAARCALAIESCREARPPFVQVPGAGAGEQDERGHFSACFRWAEVADNLEALISPQSDFTRNEAQTPPVVLKAKNIKKYFKLNRRGFEGVFSWKPSVVRAVDDISVQVRRGFTMGFVGESGCGKTTFARCIAGLVEATGGEIELDSQPVPYSVSDRPDHQLKKIQVVFQNPEASLNPQHTIGKILGRPLVLLDDLSNEGHAAHVHALLQAVNLPEEYVQRLPHELSGGEKQRVAIARAFAADPALMICDEPISSLDVSVQASLMNLLVNLQQARGTSYLFISHDLAAVRHVSDYIAVVYLGRLWEIGPAEDVFAPPYHPYTEALLSAIPIPEATPRRDPIRLRGSVPSALNIPSGCRFHTRCPRKIGALCETVEPPWQPTSNDHKICCHIPLDELRQMHDQNLEHGDEGVNR